MSAEGSGSGDRFAGVRAALRQDSPLWRIEHLDITCDGCEQEPIIGHRWVSDRAHWLPPIMKQLHKSGTAVPLTAHLPASAIAPVKATPSTPPSTCRFKCTVCEDIDMCGACMRALVAARIKMAQEAAPHPAPPRQAAGARPRRWVSKLHSRDLAAKWAALQTAVPCLHTSHKFQKVVDGPERAIVFLAGQPPAGSGSSGGTEEQKQKQQQQQQQQPAAEAAAEALAAVALDDSSTAAAPSSSSSSSSCSGLEQFLATFQPSRASCADVAWICVEAHPESTAMQQPPPSPQQQQAGISSSNLDERVDAAVEDWEQLTAAAAKSGRRITAADVDRLAEKHRILKGKWMLFARSGAEADAAWAAVARAVCAEPAPGQPPTAEQQPGQQQWRPLCGSAKCSSTAPPPDSSWVLCAYADNYLVRGLERAVGWVACPAPVRSSWLALPGASSPPLTAFSPVQDAEDVQRVCRGLQRAVPSGLLQDRRLLFKPDIYT